MERRADRPNRAFRCEGCVALHGVRCHFLAANSCIPARSNICTADSFFRLKFPSSSAFGRPASDTAIPEYFAVQT